MLAYRYNVSRRFYRADWYDLDFVSNVTEDPTDLISIGSNGRRAYDWTKAEIIARSGALPKPPTISALEKGRYSLELQKIVDAAKKGAVDTLRALEIDAYNSAMTAIEKYRKLCITALVPKV